MGSFEEVISFGYFSKTASGSSRLALSIGGSGFSSLSTNICFNKLLVTVLSDNKEGALDEGLGSVVADDETDVAFWDGHWLSGWLVRSVKVVFFIR